VVPLTRAGANAKGIILAGVHQWDHAHSSGAYGDYDSPVVMGRISIWTTGAIDLEVLRVADGEDVYFGHTDLSDLEDDSLKQRFDEFSHKMANPDLPK
jgi:hypothetical protein